MGMDVIGTNPVSETGEYFRANVWYWHPIWGYVEDVHPDIAELVEYAHSNDGDGLDAENSKKLAKRLKEDYRGGKIHEYHQKYQKELSELPMDECRICEGTGVRTDQIGVDAGWDTKELPEDVKIIVGRERGSCNACSGLGKTEAWATNYPFDPEVMLEFAYFLEDCGGFQIC